MTLPVYVPGTQGLVVTISPSRIQSGVSVQVTVTVAQTQGSQTAPVAGSVWIADVLVGEIGKPFAHTFPSNLQLPIPDEYGHPVPALGVPHDCSGYARIASETVPLEFMIIDSVEWTT